MEYQYFQFLANYITNASNVLLNLQEWTHLDQCFSSTNLELIYFFSNIDGFNIPSGSKIDETKLRIFRLVQAYPFR